MDIENDVAILNDLLSTKVSQTPSDVNIETKLLHPIYNSDSECKFVFDRNGILSSDSRLSLQLTQPAVPAYTETVTMTAIVTSGVNMYKYNTGADITTGAVTAGNTTITIAGGAKLLTEGQHLPVKADVALAGDILFIKIDTTAGNALNNKYFTITSVADTLITVPNMGTVLGAGSTICIFSKNSFVIPTGKIKSTTTYAGLTSSVAVTGGPITGTIATGSAETVKQNALFTSGVFVVGDADGANVPQNTKVATFTRAELQEITAFPLMTGVHSMIESATFSIGGSIVNRVSNSADYKTFKNWATTPEQRKLRKSIEEGVIFDLEGATGKSTVANETITGLFKIPGTEPRSENRITSDSNTSPVYSIKLSDIIPMLQDFEVPLFAIKEEVALNIKWSKNAINVRVVQGDIHDSLPFQPTSIVAKKLYIMADYIYYPALMERMSQVVAKGYSIPYKDIINIKMNELGSTTAPSGQDDTKRGRYLDLKYTKQLGLGGKNVKSIVLQRRTTPNNLFGQYVSNDLYRPDSFNLRYNSENHYQTDVNNKSVMYNEVSKVMNGQFKCNNYLYTFMGQQQNGEHQKLTGGSADEGNFEVTRNTCGLSNQTFMKTEISSLAGCQNWTGVDLRNSAGQSLKMSNLPIVLTHTTQKTDYLVDLGLAEHAGGGSAGDAQEEYQRNTEINAFCEVVKTCALKNGIAVVYE
tara:strand:+ start:742 stop:2835 length:2094 start_codon:yes stop_codon:yes gene_type:complete